MKKIKYNGSLTDDIRLINNHVDPNHVNHNKRKISLCLLIGFNALCLVTSLITGVFAYLGLTVSMSSLFFTLYTNSRIRFNSNIVSDRFYAMSRICELVLNFKDENGNIILPLEQVTYETMLNAVIVPQEEKEEDNNESSLDVDFEIFYQIITNDIYFLDSSNKIRALREIKKVLKFVSTNSTYTHESELQFLEDKDLPNPLPVKKALELK